MEKTITRILGTWWGKLLTYILTILISDIENAYKLYQRIFNPEIKMSFDIGNIIVGAMLAIVIIGYAKSRTIQTKNEKLVKKIKLFVTFLRIQNDIRFNMSKSTTPSIDLKEREKIEFREMLDKKFGIDLTSMNEPLGSMTLQERDYVVNCFYGNWNYWNEDDYHSKFFES
jgi:hypothetical protein